MEKKYNTLDLNINKLTHHQNKNLDTNTQFYPRVISLLCRRAMNCTPAQQADMPP
jgi:type II secretory pathway predicted ATPase ExeA